MRVFRKSLLALTMIFSCLGFAMAQNPTVKVVLDPAAYEFPYEDAAVTKAASVPTFTVSVEDASAPSAKAELPVIGTDFKVKVTFTESSSEAKAEPIVVTLSEASVALDMEQFKAAGAKNYDIAYSLVQASADEAYTGADLAAEGNTASFVVTVAEAPVVEDVAEPVFNPAAGEVEVNTKIELTSTTQDAEIYFSYSEFENTAEVSGLTKYEATSSQPEITAGQLTVYAMAVKGDAKSDVVSATYTIKAEEVIPVLTVTNPSESEEFTIATPTFNFSVADATLGSDVNIAMEVAAAQTSESAKAMVVPFKDTIKAAEYTFKEEIANGSYTATFTLVDAESGAAVDGAAAVTRNFSVAVEVEPEPEPNPVVAYFTMPETMKADTLYEFTTTIKGGDSVGKLAIVECLVADKDIVDSLNYYEVASGMEGWKNLTIGEDGRFMIGSPSGFPLVDSVTTMFRVQFKEGASVEKYAVSIAVRLMKDGQAADTMALASDTIKVYTEEVEPEPDTVANPVFDPASGEVAAGTEVKITCATEDAKIYFSTGEIRDSLYVAGTTRLVVNSDTTFKAYAMIAGEDTSDVVTVSYTVKEVEPEPDTIKVVMPTNLKVELFGDSAVLTWTSILNQEEEVLIWDTTDVENPVEVIIKVGYGRKVALGRLSAGVYGWSVRVVKVGSEAVDTIAVKGPEFTIEKQTSVENNELAGVNLYPNPTSGDFYLNVPVAANVEIFSSNGQIVKRASLATGSHAFSLNQSGVYFVRVMAANGKSIVKRVVVR